MKTLKTTAFIIGSILILIPIAVYLLYLFGPLLPHAFDLDNSDWISFLGGYIGGTVGGISTLVVVYITVKNGEFERNHQRRVDAINYRQSEIARIARMALDTYSYVCLQKPVGPASVLQHGKATIIAYLKDIEHRVHMAQADSYSIMQFNDSTIMRKWLDKWTHFMTDTLTICNAIIGNYPIYETLKPRIEGMGFVNQQVPAEMMKQFTSSTETMDEMWTLLDNLYSLYNEFANSTIKMLMEEDTNREMQLSNLTKRGANPFS